MQPPPWDIIPGVSTLPAVVTPTYFIHNKILLFLFNMIKRYFTQEVNADSVICVGRKKDVSLNHKGKKYDLAFIYANKWHIFIEIKTKKL